MERVRVERVLCVRVERVWSACVERVWSAWCAGGTHVGGAPGGTPEALAARRCAPTAPGRAACGWGPVRSDRLPPGLNAFRLPFDM